MEKIVVLTGNPDHDSRLIKCLQKLFPECEIHIKNKVPGDYDSADLIADRDDDLELDEDTEKYLSFL